MITKAFKFAVLTAVLTAFSASALADPMTITDPGLSGNTQADAWTNFTLSSAGSPGYGSFPGFGSWPGPIASTSANVGSNGDAGVYKLANGSGGGPFVSGSIYSGGTTSTPNTYGGQLGIKDATPLADLANIVFQIQIGPAFGYDFFNGVLPTLNFNGGSQAVAVTSSSLLEQYDTGDIFQSPDGDQPIYVNTYEMQWDVSALGPITDFSITFNTVQHSQVYQLRLDQSDFVNVPEPASVTLAGMALLGMLGLAWKRRSR